MAEITVLKQTKDNKYIVDYCGVKCLQFLIYSQIHITQMTYTEL